MAAAASCCCCSCAAARALTSCAPAPHLLHSRSSGKTCAPEQQQQQHNSSSCVSGCVQGFPARHPASLGLQQGKGTHDSLAYTSGQSGSVASATTNVWRSFCKTWVSCWAAAGTCAGSRGKAIHGTAVRKWPGSGRPRHREPRPSNGELGAGSTHMVRHGCPCNRGHLIVRQPRFGQLPSGPLQRMQLGTDSIQLCSTVLSPRDVPLLHCFLCGKKDQNRCMENLCLLPQRDSSRSVGWWPMK